MTVTGASSSLIDVVLHDQEASGDITFPEIPSSAASADQKEGTGTQKRRARCCLTARNSSTGYLICLYRNLQVSPSPAKRHQRPLARNR